MTRTPRVAPLTARELAAIEKRERAQVDDEIQDEDDIDDEYEIEDEDVTATPARSRTPRRTEPAAEVIQDGLPMSFHRRAQVANAAVSPEARSAKASKAAQALHSPTGKANQLVKAWKAKTTTRSEKAKIRQILLEGGVIPSER